MHVIERWNLWRIDQMIFVIHSWIFVLIIPDNKEIYNVVLCYATQWVVPIWGSWGSHVGRGLLGDHLAAIAKQSKAANVKVNIAETLQAMHGIEIHNRFQTLTVNSEHRSIEKVF